MKLDDSILRAIYAKTNGRCHICHKRLAFSNYGEHGARGAWEVDHSIPVAEGGTDHLNNLFPAHTTCNRRKQAQSNQIVRSAHGITRAPLSSDAVRREKFGNALSGAFAGGLLGARIAGPAGFWIGAIAGGFMGFQIDPD